MRLVFCGIFVVLLAHTATALPADTTYDDDYDPNFGNDPEPGVQNDYDYNEGDDEAEDIKSDAVAPEILSKSQEFFVERNGEVTLPCNTSNASANVIMWYKNNELIFQDSISLRQLSNVFRQKDKSLRITNFSEADAGEYKCEIVVGNIGNPFITHQVNMFTAPYNISLTVKHNIKELAAGETLVLTCRAQGIPKPNITWYKDKQANRLAGAIGEVLTIDHISHEDSGNYRCLADNAVDPPAHANITIEVLHKPIVSVERLLVNAAETLSTELICVVHGIPMPTVNWMKEGVNVAASDNVVMEVQGHRHILRIAKVGDNDFGDYVCSAKNYLGKSEKKIALVKTPVVLGFEIVKEGKETILTWEVESMDPITAHDLQYKKVETEEWKTVSPEVTNPDGIKYTVKYGIRDIDPAKYESRIRSKNKYGWSHWSETVEFNVKKHGHKHSHKKEHKKHTEAQDTLEPQSNTEKIAQSNTERITQTVTEKQPQITVEKTVRTGESSVSGSTVVVPTFLLISIATALSVIRC